MDKTLIVSVMALIVSAMALILNVWVAKKFGDLAGTNAAIKYEEEKDAKAYIVTLQALLHEVIRIRGLVNANAKLNRDCVRIQAVVRLPVKSFETAFVSGESNLLVGELGDVETLGLYPTSEPLKSVMKYLTEASYFNSLIDVYLGVDRGVGSADKSFRREFVNLIVDKSQELFEVLDQLEEHLRDELKTKIFG